MKAIFFILCVFATFILFLGLSAGSQNGTVLGYALTFGGLAIYLGVAIVWGLFKMKENDDSK